MNIEIKPETQNNLILEKYFRTHARIQNLKEVLAELQQEILDEFSTDVICTTAERESVTLTLEGNDDFTLEIQAQVKMEIFDSNALPGVVKPHIKETVTTTLTPTGKKYLDEWVTEQYGPCLYNDSKEFYEERGIDVKQGFRVTCKKKKPISKKA